MAVGKPAPWVVDFVLDLASHTPGPVLHQIAGVGKDSLVGRQRPVERVRRKVGPAIVAHLGNRTDRRQLRLVGRVADSLRIEPPVPAANHGAVVQAEGKPEPRSEIVRVIGKIAGQPGEKSDLLRVHARLDVPAQPQVQGQAGRHRPVILDPAGNQVLLNVVTEAGSRNGLADLRDQGRERRQVPSGRIVPHREERLDVGRRAGIPGLERRITPRAPMTGAGVIDIVGTQFRDVPPARGIREGQVIANRAMSCPLRLLPGPRLNSRETRSSEQSQSRRRAGSAGTRRSR